VHEPPMRSRFRIHAIAGAEYPKPLARIILDDEIIPDRLVLRTPLPPLPEYPLGTARFLPLAPLATPHDPHWRVVGQQSHDIDLLRSSQKTNGAPPVMD